MDVHILSKKLVKPSTPTPDHLRNLKLSFIDHLAPSVSVPLIFFYSPKHNITIQKLEKSLSETLTLFYPLAGRLLKDEFLVECNDQGAEYWEATVSGCSVDEIIRGNVEVELLDGLVPPILGAADAYTTTLVLVQVNVFECGGVAIAVRVSHKLADAITGLSFINAWATTCRVRLCEVVPPCFNLASVFPVRPDLIRPPVPLTKPSTSINIVTKRFVFDKNAISVLKAKASRTISDVEVNGSGVTLSPTRVEVVSAVIWKALISVGIAKHGHVRPSLLVHSINLRGKTTPPMPYNTCGNFYVVAAARFTPDYTKMELHHLAALVKDAMRETNKRYTNAVLGSDEFYSSVLESFEKVSEESVNWEHVDVRLFTSWCRVPLYGADFGWGKPGWVSGGSRRDEWVSLQDTQCGQGVEARISLNQQDMLHFQQHLDIAPFTI